jgi:RNA polymerase sigma-70 factor (family 1)
LLPYHTYEDHLLLQLVAESDQAAFNVLFERHRVKLYNYLYDITKVKEIAEELLMDVFMKIWFGRELAPEIRNLDAFLAKVAYNKALNFLTTTARRKHLQQLVAQGLTSSVDNPAETRLAEKETQQLLHNALTRLSPQRRLVFLLSREQGLSHTEIAAKLALSRNTVRNHIADALKTIREFLSSQKEETMFILLLIVSM